MMRFAVSTFARIRILSTLMSRFGKLPGFCVFLIWLCLTFLLTYSVLIWCNLPITFDQPIVPILILFTVAYFAGGAVAVSTRYGSRFHYPPLGIFIVVLLYMGVIDLTRKDETDLIEEVIKISRNSLWPITVAVIFLQCGQKGTICTHISGIFERQKSREALRSNSVIIRKYRSRCILGGGE